ncbi:MAG: Nucleoporin 62kDa-like protein [Glaciihabitans sp.]|nr:Nucleoporin 62kDa-like protein [Glaciihabitans sp.]
MTMDESINGIDRLFGRNPFAKRSRRRKVHSVLAGGLALSLGAIFALGTSMPASADTTGTSTATITVQGGVLSITVPVDAGSLGTLANTVGGGTITGSLGQVQVSDARGAPAGSGWVVSVISSAFTPPAGPALAASAVAYTAGAIAKVGTATFTANNPGNLTGVSPAITATGITGDNSATWNPTITVTVPGGTAAGVYSATITHSVL